MLAVANPRVNGILPRATRGAADTCPPGRRHFRLVESIFSTQRTWPPYGPSPDVRLRSGTPTPTARPQLRAGQLRAREPRGLPELLRTRPFRGADRRRVPTDPTRGAGRGRPRGPHRGRLPAGAPSRGGGRDPDAGGRRGCLQHDDRATDGRAGRSRGAVRGGPRRGRVGRPRRTSDAGATGRPGRLRASGAPGTGGRAHRVIADATPSDALQWEWTWELDAPPEPVWPLVSNTNRFNRDTGLPTVDDARDGEELKNARRRLRMVVKGVPVEWEELPFEWVRPWRFGVVRHYARGPLREMRVRATLEPLGGDRSTLVYAVAARPRGVFGWIAAKLQIGVLSRRAFGRIFREYGRHVAETDRSVPPPVNRTRPPAITR